MKKTATINNKYDLLNSANKSPVFILSHDPRSNPKYPEINIIALSLSRDLGREGVPVIRFHPNKLDFGLSSRYCMHMECPNLDKEEELLSFIINYGKRCKKKGVMFPASDECLGFINKYQEVLRKFYEIPLPEREVISNILNKKRQYEIAVLAQVDIPETFFPQHYADVIDLGKNIDYPSVIKPIIAHSWRKPLIETELKWGKAVMVKDRDELIKRYKEISKLDRNIMVQNVIQGEVERNITFLCYYNRTSELLAYCIRKKLRQYPMGFGYCCLTKSENIPVVKELANRLLRSLHYKGIAGVEFKLDAIDNRYKLIEINARPVQTVGLASAAGVNLPYICYLDMLGAYDRKTKMPLFKENVTWIYLDKEFDMARHLIKKRKLTLGNWLKIFAGKKTFAVLSFDDLTPFIKLWYLKMKLAILNRLNFLLKLMLRRKQC
ncbi:MAG: ATP-grasp domain-containing protein [Candidatus Omnitrophota bacterium]